MSNLGEELYQIAYKKGYEEGFKEGFEEKLKEKHVQILKHLMKSQNWTALQTLKAVNTPEEKISDYLALLEKN